MKTIAKIDPEKEYENAKKLIELASKQALGNDEAGSLDASVDNLITAARVLIEREERRRGHKNIPPATNKPKGRESGKDREEAKKLPSVRYPNLEVNETIVKLDPLPICSCCNKEMKESGLFDTAEKLEVIPKIYFITRIKRPKYNCSNCHGSMINTVAEPSIVPTSNYGDSLIIDVALSKYCDLIPIERYAEMAFRAGLNNELPAQSLIGLTHHLANFLNLVYEKIKEEVLKTIVLQADETPHKMLEGDETSNWYLWGFISNIACYFEVHNTRSGDVAYAFLELSKAQFLVSDGYAGYGKAIRKLKEENTRTVIEVHCNAHAYRYFKDASITWTEECIDFLNLYGTIYELERERKELQNKITPSEQLEFRKKMVPFFEEIKNKCEIKKKDAMPESGLMKACNYYLNHYDGLTICTTNIDIPLDNNLSERELRSPVIGRKTWYGSHSKRGALTSAVLFSIVQSCKLNNVNPRSYFPWIVNRIHNKESILTPHEYLLQITQKPLLSG
ncbi:MAG: IS66 family transposase [Bacteriovoracaceae bacterium]